MKEVKLWFARNENGEIVTIGESNKNEEYTCVLCGSRVIPKALESIQVQQHFAHLDVSKCTPEHAIHWWFKNKLIDVGDEITIKTNTLNTYICKSFDVEKECVVDGVTYKPDITIETEDGEIIYVEIANTNKKKFDEYIGVWSKLNNIVVELNIWDVINENTIGVLKAIYYKGLVFNDKKRKTSYQKSIGDRIDAIRQDDNRSEESINRIKSLNWFWSDICRYKFNKIGIDELMISVNEVCKNDSDIVNDLVDRQSCIDIKNDLINLRVAEVNSFIKSLELEFEKDLICENYFDSLIRLQHKKYNNISGHGVGDVEFNAFKDIESIKLNIIKYIKAISILIENDKILNKIVELLKINKDDYKLKWNYYYGRCDKEVCAKIFNGYFDRSFVKLQGLGLSFYYKNNHFNTIDVPYEIICKNDKMINYVINEINPYYKNIQLCADENKLYEICNNLDLLYQNIYITTNYDRYRFRVVVDKVEEDIYLIKLCKESNFCFKYNYFIENPSYLKSICEIRYEKNKAYEASNESIKYTYDKNNLYKLKYQLSEEFNKKILKLYNKKEILKIWGKLPYKK